MLRRSHYIALGVVLGLTLLILNLPSRTAARIKLGIGSLFLPFFGLTNSAQRLAGKTADSALPRGELLRQNEALRIENQELRFRLMQSDKDGLENDRLRQLLGWQHQQPWKLKPGRVVLREPANWWRMVQIDLGSRDGVKTNLPVMTTDGLVGRISSVGLTRSQVVLLGDPDCKVAARVLNPTRDTGVIGPGDPLDREFVEMGYLSRSADLKSGQEVITSGLGGLFPANIVIGKVVDAHTVEYGLYTVARVKLAANLSALEEVWVLGP